MSRNFELMDQTRAQFRSGSSLQPSCAEALGQVCETAIPSGGKMYREEMCRRQVFVGHHPTPLADNRRVYARVCCDCRKQHPILMKAHYEAVAERVVFHRENDACAGIQGHRCVTGRSQKTVRPLTTQIGIWRTDALAMQGHQRSPPRQKPEVHRSRGTVRTKRPDW